MKTQTATTNEASAPRLAPGSGRTHTEGKRIIGPPAGRPASNRRCTILLAAMMTPLALTSGAKAYTIARLYPPASSYYTNQGNSVSFSARFSGLSSFFEWWDVAWWYVNGTLRKTESMSGTSDTTSFSYQFTSSGTYTISVRARYRRLLGSSVITSYLSWTFYVRGGVTICTPSGGTVSPSPGTRYYTYGSSVSIRAYPASGYSFARWNYSGGVSVTSPTSAYTTMRVTGNGSLCPVFVRNNTVVVCTPAGGTVSPSPGSHTYAPGAVVSIIAYPASTYTFERWSYSGGVSVTSPTSRSTTMRVNGAGTLCPVFRGPPVVVICTPVGGTVSPSPGSHTYAAGSVVSIRATALEDWEFIKWNSSGGVSVTDRYDPTTTMRVTGPGTLCPQFQGNVYYTVEIKEPTNGSVTPPPGNYTGPAGWFESIVAMPDPGFSFLRWECTGVNVMDEYAASTDIIFTDDGSVLALFEPGGGNGGGGGPCPPEDLLAHWKLDEFDGRTAYDSAGICDGVLVGGPVWEPMGGKVDGALRFDGSNDCVVTDVVLDPVDGPFSAFAWVKGGAPNQVILSQDGAVGGADWLAVNSAGRLMTALGGRALTSSKVIVDDQWHEVGLTWDGFSRKLYVDKAVAAEDEPLGPTSSPGGMMIGTGKDFDAGSYWSGLIDDVRICNQAVLPMP